MSTEDRIKKILVEHLGVDASDIHGDSRLKPNFEGETGTLGADSLDVVELVMAVEEEFAIEVADAEAEELNTVDDLIKMVDLKVES